MVTHQVVAPSGHNPASRRVRNKLQTTPHFLRSSHSAARISRAARKKIGASHKSRVSRIEMPASLYEMSPASCLSLRRLPVPAASLLGELLQQLPVLPVAEVLRDSVFAPESHGIASDFLIASPGHCLHHIRACRNSSPSSPCRDPALQDRAAEVTVSALPSGLMICAST